MADSSSKARDRAETAFRKTQTEHLARTRSLTEADAEARARDEKTARLRLLRKEKEAAEGQTRRATQRPAKP
jgi:hypothetical protein